MFYTHTHDDGGRGGACLRGHAKEHTTVHGNVQSAHRRNAVASFRHASCARRRVCGSSITLRGVFAVLPYRGVARGLDESHKAMTPNGRMNLFIFASESTQWLWRCDLRAQRRGGHASAPERHPSIVAVAVGPHPRGCDRRSAQDAQRASVVFEIAAHRHSGESLRRDVSAHTMPSTQSSDRRTRPSRLARAPCVCESGEKERPFV